jgi:hypothetical protein
MVVARPDVNALQPTIIELNMPHPYCRGRAAFIIIALTGALSLLTGCIGKRPGPWYDAPSKDLDVLRGHYGVDIGDRPVLKRDVTVWMIGPASGYPEWAVRNEDGSIEVVAPRAAR